MPRKPPDVHATASLVDVQGRAKRAEKGINDISVDACDAEFVMVCSEEKGRVRYKEAGAPLGAGSGEGTGNGEKAK